MAGRTRARPSKRASGGASADPVEVLRKAADGKAPPILLVTGKDLFSRDAILLELRKALVAEGLEGFNDAVMSGEEVSGADLVDLAATLPFGGGRRQILVRRADRVREREIEPILAYTSAPSPETTLVLVFDDAKGALLTALRKSATVLDFPAPRDYQLTRWLEAQARRLGIDLDPDAARALADLMGENYVGAISELQCASLNAPRGTGGLGRPRVARDLIERLAGRGRDANPFHLGDAILGREPVRAVRILRDLDEEGHTGYALLGMLESQLRRFLKMRAEVDRGNPPARVVASASPTLPPQVKARIARQLESYDEKRLLAAFRIARATDRAIKTGGSGSELGHMESLVWRISAL